MTEPDASGDDRRPMFLQITIPFLVLAIISTILRFWSRAVANKNKYGWDDWTALAAQIYGIGVTTTGILWTKHGLGLHIWEISSEDSLAGRKLLWASYFLFVLGVGCIKFSALFFYSRIFRDQDGFRIPLIVGHVLAVVWVGAAIPSIIFNCVPVQKFWHPQLEGHCLPFGAWYITGGVLDTVIDLAIFILPIPKLCKLHTGRRRKQLVILAFVCGYLAVVPSIGRLISIIPLQEEMAGDFTYAGMPELIWGYIEVPIGVISLCIPSFFPLFKRLKCHGFSSLFTSREQAVVREYGMEPQSGERHNNSSYFARAYRHLGEDDLEASPEFKSSHLFANKSDKSPQFQTTPFDFGLGPDKSPEFETTPWGLRAASDASGKTSSSTR
ncbi:MAG: hypothetical protein M1831_003645 [Alyxoria varia]|nr:MAG: hypothetical protein M1831_003645 [Alyxoria varia]